MQSLAALAQRAVSEALGFRQFRSSTCPLCLSTLFIGACCPVLHDSYFRRLQGRSESSIHNQLVYESLADTSGFIYNFQLWLELFLRNLLFLPWLATRTPALQDRSNSF